MDSLAGAQTIEQTTRRLDAGASTNTILVVDDNYPMRAFYRSHLLKAGYHVKLAKDGEEAIALLSKDIALAVIDVVMPRLNGIELLKHIRQAYPDMETIVVTGNGNVDEAVTAMKLGAFYYLTKPVNAEVLIAQVRRAIQARRQRLALVQAREALAVARKQELQIGARIQHTLLQGTLEAPVKGLRIADVSIPSHQFDGDFYDIFNYEQPRCDVIIGDVMGKGLSAALIGAGAKAQLLRSLNKLLLNGGGTAPAPAAIVANFHKYVSAELQAADCFITFCYAQFDLSGKKLNFVDCGHTKPLHYSAHSRQCAELSGENVPLGVSLAEVYIQQTVTFEEGDLFLFYSDGVTEARNESGELFGVPRLKRLIRKHAPDGPEAVIRSIRSSIRTYTGTAVLEDDLTCIAVEIARSDSVERTLEVPSQLQELARIRAFIRISCGEITDDSLTETQISHLTLAANEVASNIIKHAYHGKRNKTIHITSKILPDRLIVHFSHNGTPHTPHKVQLPDPESFPEAGRGLYIIHRVVDDVVFSQDEAGRHCIDLVIKRGRPNNGEKYHDTVRP